jgi:hypothetical protein
MRSGVRALPVVALALVGFVLLGGMARAARQAQTETDISKIIERLYQTPILHNLQTERVTEIFQAGQVLGNRPNVFTTVGDSNTVNGDFMRPVGMDGYCDLGEYTHLQETIDFFMTVEPRPEQENSFLNDSVAAVMGLSTAGALDPFWSEPYICKRNENPLNCEYRLVRPSVALIMLGQVDINYSEIDTETYRSNMEQIVQTTIDQGVIPVLSTIVFLPEREAQWEQSMQFNWVLVDIAEVYEIPIINLWRAVQTLPNSGIGPDNSHLKAQVGRFCSFDGTENELGGTLRNLLNLQVLHELRRTVLAPEPDGMQ